MQLGTVLHVYDGEWGLPSIDFECLRALVSFSIIFKIIFRKQKYLTNFKINLVFGEICSLSSRNQY